jgi:hypothetical protein
MPEFFRVQALNDLDETTALAIGDYASQIRMLTAHGFHPISVSKLAEHRLNLGSNHEISWTGSRTTDMFVKQGDRYFFAHTDPASLLFNPEAVDYIQNYNATFREITFNLHYVSEMIEVPVNGLVIPQAEISRNPISCFLFGEENAEAYAQWMREIGIPALPIHVPNYSLTRHHLGDFIRPLIMRCTDNWSGIITANADLHTEYGFRGWSRDYQGELAPEETFERKRLDLVNRLIPLQDQPYSARELETLFKENGFRLLFLATLRSIRNDGSIIPANYDSFLD